MSDIENDTVEDLSSSDVTTKYMTAAGITNKALQAVVDAVKAGADVFELCQLGDKIINDECALIFNKPDKEGYLIDKGVAFPTSVSPNDISGHFSPLQNDSFPLKDGETYGRTIILVLANFIAKSIPFFKGCLDSGLASPRPFSGAIKWILRQSRGRSKALLG